MATERRHFTAIQEDFAGHIRDPEHVPTPEDVPDRRMAVYRELFFNNVRGFLDTNFPVLRRLHDDVAWNALVRDFFVRHRAHTPLFPELPREFLRFVETCRGPEYGDPPFMLELAHYEWVELALSLETSEIDDETVDDDADLLEDCPVQSPVAWLLTYRWPVHHIRPDFRPTEPPEQPTHLAVYRDRDDQIRFLTLNAVSARLLQLIEQHPEQSGAEHVEQLASELGRTADSIRRAAADVLSDLRDRSIIVGARRTTTSE